MQLDLGTHSADPYYQDPSIRHMVDHLRDDHDLDTVVVPGLVVPAAMDAWQRVVWTAPGLDRDALTVLLRDAMSTIEIGHTHHFVRRASKAVRRQTSRNAWTIDP